ncbi:MAG: sulfotransferase family protein [Cytophagales bacterium]
MKRISLWSGPRNISTAMMYAFAQRNDTTVVDEPLYAFYLKETGIDHPGREETLRSMSSNRDEVIFTLREKQFRTEIVFFKNMCHHVLDLPLNILDNLCNVFLIREPKFVIASYIKEISHPDISDLGYTDLLKMTDYLKEKGREVFLIDSRDILQNPAKGLKSICDFTGIPYSSSMLKWSKGGIREDGVWSKYWYTSLHQSEGFMPYSRKEVEIPKRLMPLLKESEIIYEILQDRSVKIK